MEIGRKAAKAGSEAALDVPLRLPLMRLTASAALLSVVLFSGSTASGDSGEKAFRITLLGTGNPRPSMTRFGPSFLVEAGGKRILVDAGRGAVQRLFQIGGGAGVAHLDLLLLTHLHSDHVVGLPDLWLTGWIFGRDRPLPVRGPAGSAAMMQNLEKAFTWDIEVRRDRDERLPAEGIAVEARDVAPGTIYDEAGIKVIAFVVDHGIPTPAYGYRIESGGRSVVFSGDTRFSESLIENARGTDVLIHEVVAPDVERRRAAVKDPTRIERIIEHHTTPEDAGRVFSRVRPRLAVYAHIVPSPTRPEDLIPATRKTYKGPLVVGADLMTITIGKTVTVGRSRTLPD